MASLAAGNSLVSFGILVSPFEVRTICGIFICDLKPVILV